METLNRKKLREGGKFHYNSRFIEITGIVCVSELGLAKRPKVPQKINLSISLEEKLYLY